MQHHKISLKTAILLNMNIMIGSGIFISPSQIAAVAGNASFLAWPVVVLLFLPLVLCTVQLSKMFPGCGGFYSYAKEGINTAAGFASGWIYIMGYVFCLAVDIMALRNILTVALGENWLTGNPLLFYIASLALFIAINLVGLRFLARLLDSLTITKLLPLIILILLLPFVLNPQFTVTLSEASMLPLSLPFAMFSFLGFEACCSVSHLIENAEKNAPRAILFGFLITATVYTFFHLGLLHVMGSDNLINHGAASFVDFLYDLPVPYIRSLLALLVPAASIITIVAGSIGLLNANATMMHSMASERIFRFSPLVTKLTSNGRPWSALLIQGIIILGLLVVMPNLDVIGKLCILAVFLAFVFPFVSLLIIEKRKRILHRIPLTILALITTISLAAYSWYTLGESVAERCFYALPLIVVMMLGYLLYTGEPKRS